MHQCWSVAWGEEYPGANSGGCNCDYCVPQQETIPPDTDMFGVCDQNRDDILFRSYRPRSQRFSLGMWNGMRLTQIDDDYLQNAINYAKRKERESSDKSSCLFWIGKVDELKLEMKRREEEALSHTGVCVWVIEEDHGDGGHLVDIFNSEEAANKKYSPMAGQSVRKVMVKK